MDRGWWCHIEGVVTKNLSTWVDKAGPSLLTRTSHATSMDPGPSKDYKRKLIVGPNLLRFNLSKLQASGSTIQMDQASSDLGARSAQPSFVLEASVKAKKKNAHDRASNSSHINTTDKKQPTHLNITSWKANGVSFPFNPKF